MGKSSGVDVRFTRTKPEWLVASFGAGIFGGVIGLAGGFILKSILHGFDKMGFGLGAIGMRPIYVVSIGLFAVVSGVALSSLRPRLLSGGSGAGVGRPAGHARLWPGLDAAGELRVDGLADEAVSDVRAV